MGGAKDRRDTVDTIELPGLGQQADKRGHTVRTGEIETGRLELVDTQMMDELLKSGDTGMRAEVDRLAATGKEGVVARDTATGHFRVLEKESLDELMNRPVEGMKSLPSGERTLDQLEPETESEDELQLVSTQMLRQILGKAEPEPETPEEQQPAYYDPYDRGPGRS